MIGSVLLASLTLGTSPAMGSDTSIYTCLDPGAWFDGGKNVTFDTWGVSANIEAFNPSRCQTAPTSASAWSLLFGSSQCDGYAQSGYAKSSGSSATDFAQYSRYDPIDPSCPDTMVWTAYGAFISPGECPSDLHCPEYRTSIYLPPLDELAHMKVNGFQFLETPFKPHDVWTEPIQSQWFGETKHVETNMPGGPNDRVRFENILTKNIGGFWWHVDWDMFRTSGHGCRYHYGTDHSTYIHIWTDPIDRYGC